MLSCVGASETYLSHVDMLLFFTSLYVWNMVYFKGCVCRPYPLMLASAVHTAYPRELVTARLGLSPRCKYHLQHVFGPCRARADKRHITRSCSFGGARTAQPCIAIENLGIHTAAAVDWRCFLGWPRSSSPALHIRPWAEAAFTHRRHAGPVL
jgi:hypothetical protein